MKRETYEPVLKNISYFVKWVEGAIVIGIVTGGIGTVFGKCVLWVSAFFQSHPWMVFLLPLTGLLVLGVYHMLGEDNNRGTNMVIESIYSNTEISFATAPAVFAGTLLTHLGGGSAGREGAALQMGGSIGTQIGKWLKFDEKDKKIAVMCGMSGVFAALFGTPMAAAIFSMEVISIGTGSVCFFCLYGGSTGEVLGTDAGAVCDWSNSGMECRKGDRGSWIGSWLCAGIGAFLHRAPYDGAPLQKISSVTGLADPLRCGDCNRFNTPERFDPLQWKRRVPD